MADVPRETPPESGEVVIDLNVMTPVEAGQAILSTSALPILRQLAEGMEPADRLRMWAGVASSLTGSMAECVGHDAATAVLEQMLKMLPGVGRPPSQGELH